MEPQPISGATSTSSLGALSRIVRDVQGRYVRVRKGHQAMGRWPTPPRRRKGATLAYRRPR